VFLFYTSLVTRSTKIFSSHLKSPAFSFQGLFTSSTFTLLGGSVHRVMTGSPKAVEGPPFIIHVTLPPFLLSYGDGLVTVPEYWHFLVPLKLCHHDVPTDLLDLEVGKTSVLDRRRLFGFKRFFSSIVFFY